MKKILLFGILFSLISCEDILKEEPKSIVVDNFYNTPDEVETAVNAIYDATRVFNCFTFLYPAQLEAYSDFSHGRGSYSILSDFQGLNTTNINRVGLIWDNFYLGIRNANIVIANAPNGNQISEEDINKYVAEAKFMRAFIYFQIVRNWGKAILRTELNMEEKDVPLSSSEDVYKLIVEDLKFAEQYLPDTPAISGRPSKWSAKTVLADVYFFQELYNEAANKADEVIKSEKFALVEVETVEDFQKLYGPDVITTTEEIFYLKYSEFSSEGWWYVIFLHHPEDPYYNGSGLFALYMDTIEYTVWNKWDREDLRRQNWYPWDFGLGPNTILTTKFIDTERVYDARNDYPFYRYADLLLLYAEASSRVNNGPTVDAMEKLNMVHRRAYGKNSIQPSEVDFNLADYSDLESFLDLVLTERGYETYLEGGKRWLDLKRTGKVKEIIKEGTGKDVVDRHLLWPFPASEMELNTALDPAEQNPGY